jgi:hypothetical protein
MVIENLEAEFGPGYSFVPEPISEGGIEMTSWPGIPAEHRGMLKTVRFGGNNSHGPGWPWISDTTLQSWRNDQAATNVWQRAKGTFVLKAFHGAPVWTPEEVRKLVSAFEGTGFKCTKTKISAKKLRSIDNDNDLGKRRVYAPVNEN